MLLGACHQEIFSLKWNCLQQLKIAHNRYLVQIPEFGITQCSAANDSTLWPVGVALSNIR